MKSGKESVLSTNYKVPSESFLTFALWRGEEDGCLPLSVRFD